MRACFLAYKLASFLALRAELYILVDAARRHKRGGRVLDDLALPADLARIPGQQAQQHAQQRRLARPGAPGDDGERAALQAEIDVRDPSP
jgi:hypothetical protein